MAARNYSNIAVETTLNSGITSGATSLTVVSATGWPSAPFAIVIDEGEAEEELVLVGGKLSTAFSSLTRGYGGTSGQAHSGGATVKLVVTAEDLALIWEHVHSGAGGDDSAKVSHDDLNGVSVNDHHNQVHAIDGADHTGTIDHGNLDGLGDDDHADYLKEKAAGGLASELPVHDHSGSTEAGTIAHSDTTGQTANDHHNKQHAIDGADHTGTLDHSEIANQGVNDHHNRDHASRHDIGGADALSSILVIGRAIEASATNIGTGNTTLVSKAITIPGDWNTYDLEVHWQAFIQDSSGGAVGQGTVVSIWAEQATNLVGQTMDLEQMDLNYHDNHPMGGVTYVEGLTSTGSRTVRLRATRDATFAVQASKIVMIAKAYRTS